MWSITKETNLLHVRQQFQAVGHGTFFTGLIAPDDPRIAGFAWVYDCGSKRTTRIASEIDAIVQCAFWPQKIDLFVLSHFDDDHVNGVERLLRACPVEKLVLPYMDASQRLAQAAAIGCDPCSGSTALLQLDPIRWLRMRGLGGRVGSIVFIRGGRPGDDDNRNANDEPRPFRDPSGSKEQRVRPSDPKIDELFRQDYLFEAGAEALNQPECVLWEDSWPASLDQSPFEFTFFNTTQHGLFVESATGARIAKRSGVPLARVQTEIQAVIDRYGLADPAGPKRQWRDKLRTLYDRHFGHSSQARNNISLCLLVRPLSDSVLYCGCFDQRDVLPTHPHNRWGILCLGDLRINGDIVAEMKKHFGMQRWNSLALVQVPHHGSTHSWTSGNAKLFDPDWFVHCVPDSSCHHPHPDVVKDLTSHMVASANYRTGVGLNYYLHQ